ncbi:hypothetical protein QJQ45_017615, partial [Haematococcus lacustris]
RDARGGADIRLLNSSESRKTLGRSFNQVNRSGFRFSDYPPQHGGAGASWASMSFAFKKFSFFTHSELQNHAYPRNATCCTPTPHCCAVGCDNGSIHLLNSAFQLILSFQAHGAKVFELVYVEACGLLVSCGAEEPGISSATLKLWDMSRLLGPSQGHARPAAPTLAGATGGQLAAGGPAGGGQRGAGGGPGGAAVPGGQGGALGGWAAQPARIVK